MHIQYNLVQISAPQIHPKIDKNWYLGLSVSIGCPPGPQDHQNGPKYPKKSLKVSKMTVLDIKSYPFQQSTCQQLPVDQGPAAGGEALKYKSVWGIDADGRARFELWCLRRDLTSSHN